MKIICIGGGPAGLYFAISMKLRDPSHDITILERNRPDDTFGWGVVLSDQTLGNLRNTDPVSAATIGENFYHWDDVETHFRGQVERSGGHGFCGIGRMKLLNILQARAAELGVDIRYEAEVDGTETFADADLVIAGDGVNSRIRNAHAEHFRPDIDVRANKYMWLGTHQKFDAFTFIFEQTDAGWIWIHAYQFDQETSTFIVECGEETWRGLGFDKLDTDETITKLEEIFAGWLGGHKLMSNARHLRGSAWLNFNRVSCETWRHKNIILMGDAAHTAHFSIGSGTKLALEDAIDLSARLHEGKPLDQALADYEDARRTEVLRLQSAARNSTEWFEHVERYVGQSPEQFNYGLLTRSQRISHEELRLRDPDWLARLEDWFLTNAGGRRTDSSTPHVRPLPVARHDPDQPGRGLAHVDVFRDRWSGRRFSSRPLRITGTGRGRAGNHRNDRCQRRRPDHAGLCRSLFRGSCYGVETDYGLRPPAQQCKDRPATGTCRAERINPDRLGRHGPAAAAG